MFCLDAFEYFIMHAINGRFELAHGDGFNYEVHLAAFSLQVALYHLVGLEPSLPLGTHLFNLVLVATGLLLLTLSCPFLLEQHGESAFNTEPVTDRIDRQQERNDQTASLIDLLHLFLHRLQCSLNAVFRWRDLSDYPVLQVTLLRFNHLNVTRRVDVGAIDNQRFAISEAFADVKIATITHAATGISEGLNDLVLRV